MTGTPNGPTGLSASTAVLNIGSTGSDLTVPTGKLFKVYDPASSSEIAHMPALTGFDTGTASDPSRTVYASFAQNLDTSSMPESEFLTGQLISTDGGATFPTYQQHTGAQPAGMFTVRLRSGELFSINFKPLTSSTGTRLVFRTQRSTDDGVTWNQGSMTWTPPPGVVVADNASADIPPSARMGGAPLELADGTIVVPVYAAYKPAAGAPAGGGHTAELLQSTDGGHTFTRRSVVGPLSTSDPGYPDGDGGYSEFSVARRVDGKLLAVLRRDNLDKQLRPLRQRISSDGGLTWSGLTDSQISFDGAAPAGRPGINPQLTLLPNGTLLLSGGRDNSMTGDNWVAMSASGLGDDWKGQLTFRNCDTQPTNNYAGSSGNTGLAWSESNTAVQMVDNCQARTSPNCEAPASDYTEGIQQQLYRRTVHALTPGTGKIDLAGKYRAGSISVSGTLDYATATHPRTGVAGAFDGSSEYWSSAVATGAGEMVIQLDRTYRLTKVGLSLRTGLPESARISFSTDGTTWAPAAVTVTGRTDYSLRYTDLPGAPIAARYVKIEVDPSTDCDAGLGTSCAFLNEVELYSTLDTFENDAVLTRPRGWSNISTCWVTRAALGETRQALVCRDDDDQALAGARYLTSLTPTKSIELGLKPIASKTVLIDVRGKNAANADVVPFHFGIFPDGQVKRYSTSGWVTVAPAGTVPVGQWSTLSITASTTSATIAVNGTTVGTDTVGYQSATALQGLGLGSSGTVSTGDYFAVDDVYVS